MVPIVTYLMNLMHTVTVNMGEVDVFLGDFILMTFFMFALLFASAYVVIILMRAISCLISKRKRELLREELRARREKRWAKM